MEHIDYEVGANVYEKKKALRDYGINYEVNEKQISWSHLQKNINKKYPIAVSAFDPADEGHAVTVYGYRTTGTSDYIVLWNSGNEKTQIVNYKAKGSTFSYNNTTWTWEYTLSYYR